MAETPNALPVSVPPESSFEEFLVDTAIASPRRVMKGRKNIAYTEIAWPSEIRAYCPTPETCEGLRRHVRENVDGFACYRFAVYKCADCAGNGEIAYGIEVLKFIPNSLAVDFQKTFQSPPFGTPIPSNFYSVIGESNREHFLQARRSIARGLGVGAYAYYRRIIENEKLNLVSAVLKVARATSAPADQIATLEAAAKERQFSKSIGMLNDIKAIPAVLLIDGDNPLALLHNELSAGIHELSDADCLSRAQHAETILFELARLMRLAITERKELKQALSAIRGRSAEKSADSSSKSDSP